MSNINLLPWRAQQEAKQKRRVLLQLGLVGVLSLGIVYAAGQVIKRQTQQQQLRNNQLQQASIELDGALHQLEQIRQQEQQLKRRRDTIAQLQLSRYQALHLFNQLPSWLPTGVRLDSVQLTPPLLTLKGQAQSYDQLSLLVQQIEQTAWLTEPRLQVQAHLDTSQSEVQQFVLQLRIVGTITNVTVNLTTFTPEIMDEWSTLAATPIPEEVP